MGRLVSLDQYLNALAEKTVDNSRQLKRGIHQRRNGMEDLYGVCFSAHATEADADTGRYNARFYVSLSPDYIYLQRFAFKFVIMPSIVEDEDPSTDDDWRVSIGKRANGDPIDITAYLKEQHEGDWIDGEGIFPTSALADQYEDFYDILDVASVMIAEGDDDGASRILSPTFKRVIISSKKPFSVDAYLYVKYDNLNR